MAVRGSCTARAAQVREAARAAAAKVAAVELRVTEAVDGGAPLRGWVIPGVDRFARIQSTSQPREHVAYACFMRS